MKGLLRHHLKMAAACAGVLVFSAAVQAFAGMKTEVTNQTVMQVVTAHIQKSAPWGAHNVRVEFLPPLPNLAGTLESVSFRVESRPREEYIGDTFFNVRILSNGIFRKEGSVRVRIEVLQDIVVAARGLDRGTELTTEDVRIQRRWVKKIPASIIETVDDAAGKMLTATVRPNALLSKNMLRDVLPVRRGKMVQVILDKGPMTMVMNGLAEEDGDQDAIVRIRNLTSNKVISARVTGPSTVRIDF